MENGKKKKLSVTFVFKLPEELIVEILLRLPVRSLLRFKCVCKSWLSLISDPQFAISHFDLNAAPSYRLLLRSTTPSIESHRRIDIDIDASIFMTLLPPRSTTRSIKSLDVEASLRHGSAVVNLLLPPPPSSNGDSHEDVEILGSCRGLVLLLYRSGDLVLWNPSTGVHKRISHSPYGLFFPFLPGGGFYGFGYDAPTDDYFVIFMVLNTVYRTQVEVFSLRTNSWDRVKCQRVNFQYEFLGHVFMAGSPLNGALHWLVYSPDNMEHVIIGFDLIERTLFEIPLPDDISLEPKHWLCPPRLRVMGGCLALCYPRAGKRDGIEIWVMKEYKVPSTWTKSIAVSTSCGILHKFFPVCFTKCGGIFGAQGLGRLVKLDDEGQLLEDFRYAYHRVGASYEENLHAAMYRESLLSPPVDFGEAQG